MANGLGPFVGGRLAETLLNPDVQQGFGPEPQLPEEPGARGLRGREILGNFLLNLAAVRGLPGAAEQAGAIARRPKTEQERARRRQEQEFLLGRERQQEARKRVEARQKETRADVRELRAEGRAQMRREEEREFRKEFESDREKFTLERDRLNRQGEMNLKLAAKSDEDKVMAREIDREQRRTVNAVIGGIADDLPNIKLSMSPRPNPAVPGEMLPGMTPQDIRDRFEDKLLASGLDPERSQIVREFWKLRVEPLLSQAEEEEKVAEKKTRPPGARKLGPISRSRGLTVERPEAQLVTETVPGLPPIPTGLLSALLNR